eukprot:1928689-Prymnesium_polylepis.1
MIAQPHDGLASPCGSLRELDGATARPHVDACPGVPPLSGQPAGDAGGSGRSAAVQLGVAVVSTRAH